jgi:hypothetical protein
VPKLSFNYGKHESRFPADILNEALEYGINFPAFWYNYFLFKSALAQ